MKRQTLGMLGILVGVVMALSCAKAYHDYTPETELPRMVYVEDEVESLTTVPGWLVGKRVFVEVTTTDCVMETGKLIRITENVLVMSPHYYYSTVQDSMVKLETERVIPKDEIVILKIY